MVNKILIADDEPGQLATVGALLRERGYTVWTAGDGQEAIQKAVDNRPDLFEGATEAISEVGGYSVTFGGQRAYLLQTGEKALVWIKLVARGTAAHGSRVIRNNAVTKLARAVAAQGFQFIHRVGALQA